MEAVQLGATGYVRKPFTAEQIKEKLIGLSRDIGKPSNQVSGFKRF